MISRYNTFLGERLFESAVNESIIYYTKEFKDALYKLAVKNKIAKDLIDVEYTDVKPDMTFIGMSDKEGYFSFTQIKKAVNAVKKSTEEFAKTHGVGLDTLTKIYTNIENGKISQSDVNYLYNGAPWNLKDKARSDAKIAKLVNQIFPDKYTNKEVEEFTNLFKKIGDTTSEFVLVEGEDIRTWYNEDKYEFTTGELGSSCMRYRRCASYLDIYVENPEVCRLLLLKSEDGEEIRGRVLIWKIDIDIENVEYYMDRIYAIDDATKLMFQEYADKQGWLKRLTSNYGDSKDFKLGTDIHKDIEATVQLKKWKYDYYPYMDTFKRLKTSDGLLINDDDSDDVGYYIMTHTDGTYEDTSGKWSNFFDETIPENEAIYSNPLDDWIYREDSIEVEVGSRCYRGYYPEGYSGIITDCVTGKFIHEDDSTYSEWYDGSFLENDITSAITWIDEDSNLEDCNTSTYILSDQDTTLVDIDDMECAEYLSKFSGEKIAGGVVNKSRVTGKYYFNDHSVRVYRTEKGIFIDEDCKALGLKVPEKNFYWTDRFAYNYKMDAMTKQTILKALKEKINQIENMEGVLGSGRQKRLFFKEPDNKDFLDDEDYIKASRYLLQSLKSRLNNLEGWI